MDKLCAQFINEIRKHIDGLDISETRRSLNALVKSVKNKLMKEESHD